MSWEKRQKLLPHKPSVIKTYLSFQLSIKSAIKKAHLVYLTNLSWEWKATKFMRKRKSRLKTFLRLLFLSLAGSKVFNMTFLLREIEERVKVGCRGEWKELGDIEKCLWWFFWWRKSRKMIKVFKLDEMERIIEADWCRDEVEVMFEKLLLNFVIF